MLGPFIALECELIVSVKQLLLGSDLGDLEQSQLVIFGLKSFHLSSCIS